MTCLEKSIGKVVYVVRCVKDYKIGKKHVVEHDILIGVLLGLDADCGLVAGGWELKEDIFTTRTEAEVALRSKDE